MIWIFYTCIVHAWDTFFPTRVYLLSQFDLFKFTFWFVIPHIFHFKVLGKAGWSFCSVKPIDYGILGGFFLIRAFSVFSIRWFPSLAQYYVPKADGRFLEDLEWNLSWLLGWEFLHRAVLPYHLEKFQKQFDRINWLPFKISLWIISPVLEFIYHLQKPFPEAVGMFFFGTALTYWSIRRKNFLFPLLVHGFIETALSWFLHH